MAETGDPERFALPRPMLGRREAELLPLRPQDRPPPRGRAHRAALQRDVADLCAGFQAAVVDVVVDRAARGAARLRRRRRAPDRPGGRRRRRGQRRDPPGAGRAGRRGGPRLRRAAPGALRRQRRDDRLGRASSACASAWSTTSPRRPAPAGPSRKPRPRGGDRRRAAPLAGPRRPEPEPRRPAATAARWRDLVDRRCPRPRPASDWPVRLDHCFARILLDNACGGPWRESVAAPAWANMPPERLAAAIDLGEAVLAGRADLALLNRRSLQWRGKRRAPEAARRPSATASVAPAPLAPLGRRALRAR